MQEELVKHNIHLFLEYYQIKTSNGVPFEFYNHPFMWDIFEDMSDEICMLKAPQVGASEMSIVKIFWAAKNKGWDIIYTLPAANDVNDFAGGKINRIIAQNPIFAEWVHNKDSVEQKSIGNNRIYFRGTWTSRAAMMVSSDLNVHDEIDASNQETITQYETRQQANQVTRKWTFSHPSVVGNGVDKEWNKSDKKEWFITCPHCSDFHKLSWPDSIDTERKCYICTKCKEPIDDDVRRHGEWVQTAKGKVSGYHISQLMCPWISAEKILKEFKEKDSRYFHNFVLGIPYADPSNQVTLDVIERSIRPKTIRKGRVIFGVDTGLDIRYVGGDMGGLFLFDEVKSFEDLERNTLKRYPTSIMLCDALGDIHGIRLLQEKYPGRIFLCYYGTAKKSMQMIKWGEGEDFGTVIIERDRLIQMVVDEFNDNRMALQGTNAYWHPYYLHWAAMYRMNTKDSLGNLVTKWDRNGRNDWAMATTYWRVCMDRFAEYESSFVGGESRGFVDGMDVAPTVVTRGGNNYAEFI